VTPSRLATQYHTQPKKLMSQHRCSIDNGQEVDHCGADPGIQALPQLAAAGSKHVLHATHHVALMIGIPEVEASRFCMQHLILQSWLASLNCIANATRPCKVQHNVPFTKCTVYRLRLACFYVLYIAQHQQLCDLRRGPDCSVSQRRRQIAVCFNAG